MNKVKYNFKKIIIEKDELQRIEPEPDVYMDPMGKEYPMDQGDVEYHDTIKQMLDDGRKHGFASEHHKDAHGHLQNTLDYVNKHYPGWDSDENFDRSIEGVKLLDSAVTYYGTHRYKK